MNFHDFHGFHGAHGFHGFGFHGFHGFHAFTVFTASKTFVTHACFSPARSQARSELKKDAHFEGLVLGGRSTQDLHTTIIAQ